MRQIIRFVHIEYDIVKKQESYFFLCLEKPLWICRNTFSNSWKKMDWILRCAELISVASCQRSFSKLKLVKNYLRSIMGQERLVNLAVLSTERKISKEIDFTEVIDNFLSIDSYFIFFTHIHSILQVCMFINPK